MRFCFLTPVWGRAYIEEYAEYSIPTLLAPGNLPALARRAHITYRVMTDAGDARRLWRTAAFRRLAELAAVDIVAIDDLDKANPTHAMSRAYMRGLRRSIESGAAFFILTPDHVFADGAVMGLARPVLEDGKRAVMSDGIRLASEAVKPHLDERRRGSDGEVIAAPPRELAALMAGNLHPISQSRLYRSERHNAYPGILYWRVGDDGILVRSFHPHPFVVRPEIPRAEFRSTIDHDYVLQVCPDPESTVVVGDSDQALVCELSAAGYVDGNAGAGRATPEKVAEWAAYWANPHHRRFAEATMRFHAGELDGRWQAVEAEAEAVVRRVQDLLDRPAWWLALNHPRILIERRRRRRERPTLRYAADGRPLVAATRAERLRRLRPGIYPGLRDLLVGRLPHARILHPFYFAYRDRARALESVLAGLSGRVLLVGSKEYAPLPRSRRITTVSVDQHRSPGSDVVALLDAPLPFAAGSFAAVVWPEVPPGGPVAGRLEQAAESLADGGLLYLDISAHYPDFLPDPGRPLQAVHTWLLPALPAGLHVRRIDSYGTVSTSLALLLTAWANHALNASRPTRLLKALLLPLWLVLVAAINLAMAGFDRLLPAGPIRRKGYVVCEKLPAARTAAPAPEAPGADHARAEDAPAEAV